MEKRRKLLFWVIAILIAICAGLSIPLIAQASEKVFEWKQEGISPFWKTPLRSEKDLKAMFQNDAFKSKLAKRLQAVEPNWDGKEVAGIIEKAVRNGEFERVTIEPRSSEAEFEWMLYGATGKTEATLWAGSHNLNGYSIPFEYRGENQEVVFGNHCVNVLKRRKKAEVPPGDYRERRPRRTESPSQPRDYAESAPPVNNYYYSSNYQSSESAPPSQPQMYSSPQGYYGGSSQMLMPMPIPMPFPYYRDDSYYYQPRDYQQRHYEQRNYQQREYQPRRDYQPRQHQPRRDYQPRQHVRPPTVHTRPAVQSAPSVRPPTVRTR